MRASPLHVITNWSARGGAESMLGRYLRRSKSRPQRVIALLDAEPALWGVTEADASVRRLRAGGLPALIRAVLALRKEMKAEPPAAILCWLYHSHFAATLAARLAGVDAPIYWNIRGCLHDAGGLPLLSRGTRLVVRLSTALGLRPTLGVSNSARALRQHIDAGYVPSGIVIPNGVELPDWCERPPGVPRRIGIVGRLHVDKDYPTFFRAAALVCGSVHDVRFAVAGREMEPGNDTVTRMVRAAALPEDRVDLLGEQQDLTAFYRSIDLLVLSSRTEGFPNVLIEAMSHGVPCVATDVGDAADILGEVGRIVPPRDPEALASATIDLLGSTAEAYSALRREARRRVETQYEIGRIVAEYDRLLGVGGAAH